MAYIFRSLAVGSLVTLLASAAGAAAPAGAAAAKAAAADDGQWSMPSKDYAATRYSTLSQITRSNAHGLHPVWTFSTGVLGGHEGQPLVVNNTMYVVTPWPNVLYAFDLTKEGYPLRWKYRPAVSPNAIGVACCDSINRGAFYSNGHIYYNLLDGHTVAVDAKTGHELWNTQIADVAAGETVTMAPLVVKDRVIVGAAGGEFGIYGWLKALDATSGKIVWTGHNIGPDADMLIHPETFKPPYGQGADQGASSWANSSWKNGGAPVWGWLSYDSDLDLVYYGTGNASPYNAEVREGDNKWANSVLARRPEDGALIWAYQFTPHDNWDFDSTGAMVLADVKVNGSPVKALVHFDKNGFAYVLDRATGKLINAAPFAIENWAKSIDLQTGKPVLDPTRQTGVSKGNVKGICPSLEGAVSPASPPAYSPHLGIFFTSTNNFCMDYEAARSNYLKGTPYIGANSPYMAAPGSHNLGALEAWDAAAAKKVWEIPEPYPSWSGVLATAGDVVFYGTLDGWFKSVDATTGKVLSKFKVGSGVVGNPITFRGPDGKQYVAVFAGIGGDWQLLSGDTNSADPADVRPPLDMMKQIARHTSQGGMVWMFGL